MFIALLTLLLINPLPAWMILGDFDTNDKYLMHKLVAKEKTIKYCLTAYPQAQHTDCEEGRKKYNDYIITAFNDFSKGVPSKKIEIQEDCINKDISIKYIYPSKFAYYCLKSETDNRDKPVGVLDVIPTYVISNDTLGVYQSGVIMINMTEIEKQSQDIEKTIKMILSHEIGHAFGFADYYLYTGNKDQNRVTMGEEPSYSQKENSIMYNNLKNILTDYDLMGITILYSRAAKDNKQYPSFLKGEKGNYVNGEKEGTWEYDRSTNVERCTYSKGKKHGLDEFYDKKDGKLLLYSSIQYENGEQTGVEKIYRPNLKGEYVLLYEATYLKGKPDGEEKTYNKEDGKLKTQGFYKNGSKVGKWYNYETNPATCLDYGLGSTQPKACE